jgi:hypothetical protein
MKEYYPFSRDKYTAIFHKPPHIPQKKSHTVENHPADRRRPAPHGKKMPHLHRQGTSTYEYLSYKTYTLQRYRFFPTNRFFAKKCPIFTDEAHFPNESNKTLDI